MNIIYDENGYIDLIESQKRRLSIEKITKDDIKKLLINCGAIIIGESVIYGCNQEDLTLAILQQAILLGMGSNNVYNTILKKTRDYELINILEESEQYQECKDSYETYLKDLVDFLKMLDITTSLDISRFYSSFLEKGFFSATEKHERFVPKYSKDIYIQKILGSYVINGYSVCRHTASMLTDILNTAGIPACNLNVAAYNMNKYQKSPLKIFNLKLTNHLITGIVENNEKYAYDSSYQTYSVYSQEEAEKLGFNPESFLISEDQKEFYRITSSIPFRHKLFNKKGEMSYELYTSYPSRTITEEISDESFNRLLEILERHIKELKDFRKEQLPNLQKIKKLSQTIAPASENKITEWKIK